MNMACVKMEISAEISKKLFSSNTQQQQTILNELGIDLLSEASEYHGKIVDKSEWLSPNPDNLSNFFEKNCDDAEERMKQYQTSNHLTEQELADFREYVINEAQENEYHPGIFIGQLTCESLQLLLVTERTGGAWDCEAYLLGIFETIDDAAKQLSWQDKEII